MSAIPILGIDLFVDPTVLVLSFVTASNLGTAQVGGGQRRLLPAARHAVGAWDVPAKKAPLRSAGGLSPACWPARAAGL